MSVHSGNFSETDCLQQITSSVATNTRELLFEWADLLGATTNGNMGCLDVLKQIVLNLGVQSVGNLSETDCYKAIAIGSGVTNVGAFSSLDCLKAILERGGVGI